MGRKKAHAHGMSCFRHTRVPLRLQIVTSCFGTPACAGGPLAPSLRIRICCHHTESPYAEAQGPWVLLDAVQFGVYAAFIERSLYFIKFIHHKQFGANFCPEVY